MLSEISHAFRNFSTQLVHFPSPQNIRISDLVDGSIAQVVDGSGVTEDHLADRHLLGDVTNMVSTRRLCESLPKIVFLSSTRVKQVSPILQRLMRYEAQTKVNISKLRMFMSSFDRGICTSSSITSGQAVCEYSGNLISAAAATQLSEVYSQQGKGCFLFDVKLDDGRCVCIDSTAEDGKPGRLINHSLKKGNLKVMKVEIGESVRIFFLATKGIPANRELLFDYGDRSHGTETFLHQSPIPSNVRPSKFCGSFFRSEVLVPDSE